MKQHRKLLCRLVAVPFRKFHHGFLHDVQRGGFITHSEHRVLVGTTFDAGEEIG